MDKTQHFVIDFKEPHIDEWEVIPNPNRDGPITFNTHEQAFDFLVEYHKEYPKDTDFKIVKIETSFEDVFNTGNVSDWTYVIEGHRGNKYWESLYVYDDPEDHEYFWDLVTRNHPRTNWRLRHKFEILKTYTPKGR